LHDFLVEDLLAWYPDLADKVKITLIEAQSHLLPMFSKQLVDYTEKHFARLKVKLLANTAVKQVNQKDLVIETDKKQVNMPYGLLFVINRLTGMGNRERSQTRCCKSN
jgi:NADH:ubiquinone reductase (non-electrogenic)